MKPDEILSSASPEVTGVIESILKIEREYQHFQNLDANAELRKEIEMKIRKAIDKVASDEA